MKKSCSTSATTMLSAAVKCWPTGVRDVAWVAGCLPHVSFGMRNIPRHRCELTGLDAIVFFLHPRNLLGISLHPQRDRRALALLIKILKFDDDIFARVA